MLADDYRVFVGDLGHEVNDDMLYRSFVGYPSLQKARVIRDKITKKSRGYGFVSFKDGQDYLRAMREMNGALTAHCSSHFIFIDHCFSTFIVISQLIHCAVSVVVAGKYCGNHPMKLRKSTWRERNDEVVKRKAKKRAKLGFKPVH